MTIYLYHGKISRLFIVFGKTMRLTTRLRKVKYMSRDFYNDYIKFVIDAIKGKKERESRAETEYLGIIVLFLIALYLMISKLNNICKRNLNMTLEDTITCIGAIVCYLSILFFDTKKIIEITTMNYKEIRSEYKEKFRKEYEIGLSLSTLLILVIATPVFTSNHKESLLFMLIMMFFILFLFGELFKRLIILFRFDKLKSERKKN